MSLKEIIQWIFKEHTSLKEVYNSHFTTWGNIIGDVEIAISFLVIGLVFIFISPKSAQLPAKKERIRIGKLIGWALIACSIARVIGVVAIWYNYGNLGAIIKNITGIIGLTVIVYLPYILRLIKKQTTIEEVKNSMEETHKKVEELKDLTKKIDL